METTLLFPEIKGRGLTWTHRPLLLSLPQTQLGKKSLHMHIAWGLYFEKIIYPPGMHFLMHLL